VARGGWVAVALNQGPNHPPVADAGADTTVECAGPDGAQVLLDGSGSFDADSTAGTQDDITAFDWFEDYGGPAQRLLGSGETLQVVLPLGDHLITLRVTDRAGASATDQVSVTVADTLPPQLTIHLTPDLLWPPNNRMVDVTDDVRAVDACGGAASITLVSIQGSGPGTSDSHVENDVSGADFGTPDLNFEIRARRSTSKQGWSYQVTYSATDAAGNHTTVTGVVQVPHDHRRSGRHDSASSSRP
jgi:hypothetical protein